MPMPGQSLVFAVEGDSLRLTDILRDTGESYKTPAADTDPDIQKHMTDGVPADRSAFQPGALPDRMRRGARALSCAGARPRNRRSPAAARRRAASSRSADTRAASR